MTNTTKTRENAEWFKVQTDITGSMLLVYNEDRSVMKQMPPAEAQPLIDELKLSKMEKVYVEGFMLGDQLVMNGSSVLREPTSWPDW